MEDKLYDEMYQLEDTHWWFSARRNIISSVVKQIVDTRFDGKKVYIADCGCGCGSMLEELTKYGKVTGMDNSAKALNYSRRKFRGKTKYVDISYYDERVLHKEKYDIILLLDVLEHIENRYVALDNVYKMLKPGGYIIVTVPAFNHLWSGHDVIHNHFRRYDRALLVDEIMSCKFKLEYISYYNFFLYPATVLVRLITRKKSLSNPNSNTSKTNPTVNTLLRSIFKSEKRHILKRDTYPFGVSLIAIARK